MLHDDRMTRTVRPLPGVPGEPLSKASLRTAFDAPPHRPDPTPEAYAAALDRLDTFQGRGLRLSRRLRRSLR